MKKYMVVATFDWHDELMQHIPGHRAVIDRLIQKGRLETYMVSMEVQTAWITILAKSPASVHRMLRSSPLYPHLTLEIAELMWWDGQSFRLPALVMN